MLHIDKKCYACYVSKKAEPEVSDKKQVLYRVDSTGLGNADRLYPRASIDPLVTVLPDNVLS